MRDSELAYKSRANLKGRITGFYGEGYTITTAGGAEYKGVTGGAYTWRTDDQVLFSETERGYTIIGYAPTGQPT